MPQTDGPVQPGATGVALPSWLTQLFESPQMKQLVWYVAELAWKVAQAKIDPTPAPAAEPAGGAHEAP